MTAEIKLVNSHYSASTKRREVRRFLGMAGYYRRYYHGNCTSHLAAKKRNRIDEFIQPSQADALTPPVMEALPNAFQAGRGCQ